MATGNHGTIWDANRGHADKIILRGVSILKPTSIIWKHIDFKWFLYYSIVSFLDEFFYVRFRNRHESSERHKNAMKFGTSESELEKCSGLDLCADGRHTLLGQIPDILRLWIWSGCIQVKMSVLEKVLVFCKADGQLVVQDAACFEDSTRLRVRGKSCCSACLAVADRAKVVQSIREWSLRISFVDLTHSILHGDQKEILQQAELMKLYFPELESASSLASMCYKDAYTRTRNYFMCIPFASQTQALKDYVSRSLKYLTPGLVCGLPSAVRKQANIYIESLVSGQLQQRETDAMVGVLVI